MSHINAIRLLWLWDLNARSNVRSPYMTCDKCGLMITGKLEVQGTQAGIPLLLIRFCLWWKIVTCQMQLYRLGSPTDEESEVAENPICSELSLLGLMSFSSIISDSFIPFCLLTFWYYITNRTREFLEESERGENNIYKLSVWLVKIHAHRQ